MNISGYNDQRLTMEKITDKKNEKYISKKNIVYSPDLNLNSHDYDTVSGRLGVGPMWRERRRDRRRIIVNHVIEPLVTVIIPIVCLFENQANDSPLHFVFVSLYKIPVANTDKKNSIRFRSIEHIDWNIRGHRRTRNGRLRKSNAGWSWSGWVDEYGIGNIKVPSCHMDSSFHIHRMRGYTPSMPLLYKHSRLILSRPCPRNARVSNGSGVYDMKIYAELLKIRSDAISMVISNYFPVCVKDVILKYTLCSKDIIAFPVYILNVSKSRFPEPVDIAIKIHEQLQIEPSFDISNNHASKCILKKLFKDQYNWDHELYKSAAMLHHTNTIFCALKHVNPLEREAYINTIFSYAVFRDSAFDEIIPLDWSDLIVSCDIGDDNQKVRNFDHFGAVLSRMKNLLERRHEPPDNVNEEWRMLHNHISKYASSYGKMQAFKMMINDPR